ncbi:arginase family protein [Subtercola boreus]|nr:arginase family protein [Subtercola boreus]
MPATFLIVPEWQGSGSSRAMQLIDGADAIEGDLPQAVTRRVEVPLGAGESLDSGVARVSAIMSVRDSVEIALAALTAPDAHQGDLGPGIVVTIGGDCGVELAPISAAMGRAARSGGRLAVVWLDGHADLMTPGSPVPGAFSGMVLRTLLGDGPELLVPLVDETLDATRVVLAGVRSVDEEEEDFIARLGIPWVPVDGLGDGSALVAALEGTGATEVYLHVDLDVLDPAEIAALSYPEPFGISVATLVANIVAVRQRFPLAGAGITQFAPSSPDAASDDLSAVLRIISALTRTL